MWVEHCIEKIWISYGGFKYIDKYTTLRTMWMTKIPKDIASF